jgi:hypothetical protein
LPAATARKADLIAKAQTFNENLKEIRAKFGNPFFYSRAKEVPPESNDKSITNYTGQRAHEPGLSIVLALRKVERELNSARAELSALGVSTD